MDASHSKLFLPKAMPMKRYQEKRDCQTKQQGIWSTIQIPTLLEEMFLQRIKWKTVRPPGWRPSFNDEGGLTFVEMVIRHQRVLDDVVNSREVLKEPTKELLKRVTITKSIP